MTGQCDVSTTEYVQVSRSDVPAGTLSSPSSKFRYWLCAPLRWWGSTTRLVADEIYRFPLRIAAVLRKQRLHRAAWGLPDSVDCSPATFYEECTYLLASTEDTLKLLRGYRWAGSLDRRIAIESFQMGVGCRLGNRCKQRPDGTPFLEK